MTATIHNLRDYTRHKPELDPKHDKPANVVVLPMIRQGYEPRPEPKTLSERAEACLRELGLTCSPDDAKEAEAFVEKLRLAGALEPKTERAS